MKLDVHTLFLVTIYVEAMLGLLLLFAWVQNLQIRAVAWWGFAHLMRAASVGLFGLYGEVSQAVSIDFANALLFLSFAVTWTGARVFDGRKPHAARDRRLDRLLWLIVAHLPVVGGHSRLRFLLASGIITTYTWLTAYEFWRGRAEPLVSRWPAIFMLFAHGSLFLLRTPLAAMLPWPPTSEHVRERVADGAQLRSAAVHHLDRLHPAGDGEGAHRIPPPDRGHDRSAHRHRQPPLVPARRRPSSRSAAPAPLIRRRCC